MWKWHPAQIRLSKLFSREKIAGKGTAIKKFFIPSKNNIKQVHMGHLKIVL